MRFAISRLHLSKLPHLPRKSDTGSYEVLHLSRKIISAPGPPNSSDEHVRSSSNVPRLPSFLECHKTLMFCPLLTRSTIPCTCHAKRHLNVQKWSESGVFCTFWLRNVLRATTACTFSTSQPPKVVRTPTFFNILTSKCGSRHNGVHFFDIATSKSGPNMVCFVHFDLEMCFAPQRRAIFRYRNFQKWSGHGVFLCFSTSKFASRHHGVHFFDISISKKWSEHGVFCTFWLGNVLRATTTCNFSSLMWPAGSAPAALASLLFDPPQPQIIGKTQCFATFLPFRVPASSFFSLFLSAALLIQLQMRHHGNNEEGKGTETRGYRYFMWSMMTKLDNSHWTSFFTLQEEQSLCFLKAWQSIHLGQPRITFPSPFRVAGVGRSIITRF